jgi:hypothetical protein
MSSGEGPRLLTVGSRGMRLLVEKEARADLSAEEVVQFDQADREATECNQALSSCASWKQLPPARTTEDLSA